MPKVVVPVLPFPTSFAPAVACVRDTAETRLPPSDFVSPALLGTLVRCVSELLKLGARYGDEQWEGFEAPWWVRRGPYLVARCEKSEYSGLFRRLLEKGILINPDFPGPSVIPAEYTEGEVKPLRTLAEEWARKGAE